MYFTSRAPLRVSFFGGGTDYPEYYAYKKGSVLGMAINQYIYVSALVRPPFLKYEFSISYSKLERVSRVEDIEHPAIRVALQSLGFDTPIDLTTMATLPSQTGLGSSATFMVALLHLLAEITGQPRTRFELALEAIRLERDVLGHVCGVQDQLHAAFGGWNLFEFSGGRIAQRPVLVPQRILETLTSSLYLVFTGQTRSAPQVLAEQIAYTDSHAIDDELDATHGLVGRALELIERGEPDLVEAFGRLLHEGWNLKKRFSRRISNEAIDALYAHGLANGACGGKLCGAGAGGFLLFAVPPAARETFFNAFEPGSVVDIAVDWHGVTLMRS